MGLQVSQHLRFTIGFDEQEGQAAFAAGLHDQVAGEVRVVAQVVIRLDGGGHLAVIGGQ